MFSQTLKTSGLKTILQGDIKIMDETFDHKLQRDRSEGYDVAGSFRVQHKHIVKSYDDDLKHLTSMLMDMGALVHISLENAFKTLHIEDENIASLVIDGDVKIDRLENKIDNFAVRILALRQPVASDLRAVVATLKIASHLERIADYAEHVARRQRALNKANKLGQVADILKMGDLVQAMLVDVMEAFKDHDEEKAVEVWNRDDEIDAIYTALLKDLLEHIDHNAADMNACIHLMFMAKNIERMGDHITNIAESIHYLVHGTLWEDAHPVSSEQKKDGEKFADEEDLPH